MLVCHDPMEVNGIFQMKYLEHVLNMSGPKTRIHTNNASTIDASIPRPYRPLLHVRCMYSSTQPASRVSITTDPTRQIPLRLTAQWCLPTRAVEFKDIPA
jgi:hypothetical protein